MTKKSSVKENAYCNHKHQPFIGGPNSKLPFWLESFLSWVFAVSCLSVAMYHYMKQIAMSMYILSDESSSQSIALVPLTTHSRKEIKSKTTMERYQQLVNYLQATKDISEWTDDDLIDLIRSDLLVRRLVSLLMIKHQQDSLDSTFTLNQRLVQIWPRLLELRTSSSQNKRHEYEISIIIPAYKEDGKDLLSKLQETHDLIDSNTNRKKMEVIVVHSYCSNLELIQQQGQLEFGNITFLPDQGGGRGPCLNQGASIAKGRILTFLHADTRLSTNWNLEILKTFSSSTSITTTTACAFSFAIDTTGLKKRIQQKTTPIKEYYPPGIQAIETTANLRSHWFHLPYGDQCLSLPEYVFNYIGGFPHQCLMEDYELVRLIRHRVAALKEKKERLAILDSAAYCHVRRWQKFGVLYVTYFNSKLVNLYSNGIVTAEELYELYYGAKPKGSDDDDEKTPWELELEVALKTS